MFRQVHLFGVLVFILGFTGNAWGQNFSNVVVFGDSLSDSGNCGSLHHQSRPGLVRDRGANFGASGMNSLAGGSNYAFAGACVNPDQNAYCKSDEIFDPCRGCLHRSPCISRNRVVALTRTRSTPSGGA